MADNYSGSTTFVQASGEIAIVCTYFVTVDRPLGPDGPAGLTSWRGTYTVVEGGHLLEPGEATLRLPDGRKGAVLVNEVNHAMSSGQVGGRFVGNGAAPS